MDNDSSVNLQEAMPETEQAKTEASTIAFGIGDSWEEVAGLDMLHCVDESGGIFYDDWNDFWVPPLDRALLLKISKTNPYHGPIIFSRRNMSAELIKLSPLLNRQELEAALYNFLLFGDCGLLKIRNRLGKVIELISLSGVWLRAMKNGNFKYLQRGGKHKEYRKEDVIFIKQYDPYQQIYGVPDYMGGLQSAMLNTDATLFRRKYYKNGAHCGFIFYATDPSLDSDKEKELQDSMKASKGVGNFRSLFVNIPNGKPDGIKIIPVGDIATKDDFTNIKSVTSQDMLSAHRFPPGLSGIIPAGTSNFGDPLKNDETYKKNESIPLARKIVEAINQDSDIKHMQRIALAA
ncbi:phage portal protein [Photobacterium sanguinicancri]|uniref:phage portal protein n=1 Tax=Photobacterium sanguinicancri TaxID=875932 RepID=UPI00247FFDEF|nr:phage portal protein [Photobacterium sanguinicancri]